MQYIDLKNINSYIILSRGETYEIKGPKFFNIKGLF